MARGAARRRSLPLRLRHREMTCTSMVGTGGVPKRGVEDRSGPKANEAFYVTGLQSGVSKSYQRPLARGAPRVPGCRVVAEVW